MRIAGVLMAGALMGALAPAAYAAEIVISLPDAPSVQRQTVDYRCDGGRGFAVIYINAGANSLALVPLDGSLRIFADVLSGSGARYASGIYVWWTKGADASLYDLQAGPDAKPVLQCSESPSRP
jgi:membrane-bound inhibitor of C-type lysozyme